MEMHIASVIWVLGDQLTGYPNCGPLFTRYVSAVLFASALLLFFSKRRLKKKMCMFMTSDCRDVSVLGT